jgi:hypothetical protein
MGLRERKRGLILSLSGPLWEFGILGMVVDFLLVGVLIVDWMMVESMLGVPWIRCCSWVSIMVSIMLL